MYWKSLSLAMAFAITTPVHAATEVKDPTVAKTGSTSTSAGDTQVRVTLSLADDDNVFQLSDRGLQRLENRDPVDVVNGRLTNMMSGSDQVVSAELDIEQSLGKVLGRKTTLAAQLAHHRYQDNPEASYTDGQVTLTRKIGKGRVRAEVDFSRDRFRRNYLAGVMDLNDNGNIPGVERQYASGIYSEVLPSLTYRRALHWRQPKQDLNVHAGFGKLYRDYDEPFRNRDRRGWFAQLRVDAEVNAMLTLEVSYRREDIDAPGGDETILVDERLDGDINGDGQIKGNAPLVTLVDRSRTRSTYSLVSTIDMTEDWRARLAWRDRKSDFSSGNPLDVDHYGITETEQQISASVRWRFSKRWFLTLSYRQTDGDDIENLGRDTDEFNQRRVSLALRHRLR